MLIGICKYKISIKSIKLENIDQKYLSIYIEWKVWKEWKA